MKHYRMLSLGLLAVLGCANAEDAAVVSGDEPRRVNLSVEVSGGGTRAVKMNNGERPSEKMNTREVEFEVESEVQLGGKRPRILTVGLEVLRAEFRGMDGGRALPEELSALGVEVACTSIHGPKWMSHYSLTAGWRTAGNGALDGDGFGVQALALGRYSVSDALHLWLGARGDSLAEGSDRVNPLLGVDWIFAPRWRLSVGVPNTGLCYTFSDTLSLGLVAELKSDTYAVDDKFGAVHGLPADLKLEHLDVRAGLRVDWRMNRFARLSATAGTVALRRIDQTADNFRRRLESDGVGGLYGTIGCSFQF